MTLQIHDLTRKHLYHDWNEIELHDFLVIFHFSYALPPPSRPRENNVNIFDPNYKTPLYVAPHDPQITPVNNFNNQFGYQLVPIYIPNEGYRYFVVVPVDKWNYLNTNHINDDQNSLEQHEQQKYDKYDKYNGRYNAKLKKYKAYEKFLKPQQVSLNLNLFNRLMIRSGNRFSALNINICTFHEPFSYAMLRGNEM